MDRSVSVYVYVGYVYVGMMCLCTHVCTSVCVHMCVGRGGERRQLRHGRTSVLPSLPRADPSPKPSTLTWSLTIEAWTFSAEPLNLALSLDPSNSGILAPEQSILNLVRIQNAHCDLSSLIKIAALWWLVQLDLNCCLVTSVDHQCFWVKWCVCKYFQ